MLIFIFTRTFFYVPGTQECSRHWMGRGYSCLKKKKRMKFEKWETLRGGGKRIEDERRTRRTEGNFSLLLMTLKTLRKMWQWLEDRVEVKYSVVEPKKATVRRTKEIHCKEDWLTMKSLPAWQQCRGAGVRKRLEHVGKRKQRKPEI